MRRNGTLNYLRPDGKKWIGIPLGAAGSMMTYRESQVKAAGFDGIPKDTDGFLKLMKALERSVKAEFKLFCRGVPCLSIVGVVMPIVGSCTPTGMAAFS